MRVAALSLVPLLLAATAASAGTQLVNPSFEDGTVGWTEAVGATTGDGGVRPRIDIDASVARDGAKSLRVTGSAGAVLWPMLSQPIDVRPGDRVSLRIAARCEGVAREGRQYANSNGTLLFRDAAGNRLALLTTAVLSGDRDWVDLIVDGLAPPGAVSAEVGVFHSMTGTAWFDDVRVRVTPTAPLDEPARAAAFDALADHLRRTYSFWGLDGKPAAEALFAGHRPAAVAAKDVTAFGGALRAMLAELNDVHVWLDTPRGRVGTAPPARGAQFDVRAVLRRIDGEPLVHGRNVLAGWIGEGAERVGYLLTASFVAARAEWPLVEDALAEFADAPALVVDVRPNGGGDERFGQALAGRWTDERVEYARQRWRDATLPGLTGFGPAQSRVLEPAPAAQRYAGKVFVLSGPGCVSSTEGFLLMCKALPRVTVVGQPSRGASGNPGAFAVLPGVTVFASRWQALGTDGRCIEGVGVTPDVVVDPGRCGAGTLSDPVLDRAVELARE